MVAFFVVAENIHIPPLKGFLVLRPLPPWKFQNNPSLGGYGYFLEPHIWTVYTACFSNFTLIAGKLATENILILGCKISLHSCINMPLLEHAQ